MTESQPLLAADPPPLLALLERLAEQVLAARSTDADALRLCGVELRRHALTLKLEARRMTALVNGTYGLKLKLQETNAERTRCTWQVEEGRLAGRMAGWGLRVLPERWLNDWLGQRVAGVTFAGDQVLLEHRPLVRGLMARWAGGRSSP